jgi:hypothetical protein
MTGSNRRPSACKADALPAELILHIGDPYGIRTRVTAVKGRCLNRLTNGPYCQNVPLKDMYKYIIWFRRSQLLINRKRKLFSPYSA